MAAIGHISSRSLQQAFRDHTGASPMECLCRVRLARAHSELLTADPTTASVRQIAARWGFTHLPGFAQYYRAHYGHNPRHTLQQL
ncbi:helix-turn-helix domain-containing protein [Kitasatospora sp. NPDC049258]|uniref:helix-turn-helix domain-containing protein n=1 Tax=Kitasatospora sp. NPDC049258 TaxID=3155394 RepID=UPI00343DDE26